MDSDEKKNEIARPLPVSEPVLPRVALERVLARATELQSAGADAPEAISESRLLEVAREVGIDTNHVRQALAEERARRSISARRFSPATNSNAMKCRP